MGRVLAATYRAQDDAVYVLDEVREGSGRRARRYVRLLRMVSSPVDQPELSVEARWPRLSSNERFALVAGSGEGLWVVASPGHARGDGVHVALLLRPAVVGDEGVGEHDRDGHDARAHGSDDEVSPSWSLAGWHIGLGLLAQVQPHADARGLSYIVERRGQQEALGLRFRDLRGQPVDARDEDAQNRTRGHWHGRRHEHGHGDDRGHHRDGDEAAILRRCF